MREEEIILQVANEVGLRQIRNNDHGCFHRFTKIVAQRLNPSADPKGYGLITKSPGEHQADGYAVDAILHGETNTVYDIIVGSGGTSPAPAFQNVGQPRPSNRWASPFAAGGGTPGPQPGPTPGPQPGPIPQLTLPNDSQNENAITRIHLVYQHEFHRKNGFLTAPSDGPRIETTDPAIALDVRALSVHYGRYVREFVRLSGRPGIDPHETAINLVEWELRNSDEWKRENPGVEPWPNPTPIPVPVSSSGVIRPAEGQVSTELHYCRDVRGPIMPLLFHFGWAVGALLNGAGDYLQRQFDDAMAVGYVFGVRVFATLGYYWPEHKQCAPPIEWRDIHGNHRRGNRNYLEGGVIRLLTIAKERELVVDLSFGDWQMFGDLAWEHDRPRDPRAWDRAVQFMDETGRAIAQAGLASTVFAGQVNEPLVNGFEDGQQGTIQVLLSHMMRHLSGALWGLGSAVSDDPASLLEWREGVPLSIVHPERFPSGSGYRDTIDQTHRLSHPRFRLHPLYQSEPKGQGTSVDSTLDGGGIALNATRALANGQGFTWISGPGISGEAGGGASGHTFTENLRDCAGFRETIALARRLPADAPTCRNIAFANESHSPIAGDGCVTWNDRVIVMTAHRGGVQTRVPLGAVEVFAENGELIAKSQGGIPSFNQRALVIAERA